MTTERLIAAGSAGPVEEQTNWALRPSRLDEYIGQSELLERLRIAITAGKQRAEPVEHVLLHGPPGLGKTTLAHVIAAEMGCKAHTTSGPALVRGTDLVACLTKLDQGDVLFIDEIHRLPVAVEEFIYPAMEDFRIDVTVDSGLHARTVQIRCKPFTLIGATTRAGLLSAPLRSRFGLTHHLRYYEEPELLLILQRSARLLGLAHAEMDGLRAIAARSRGTPRIANRLLRRVRDYAQVRGDGRIAPSVVDEALALEGVDRLGLDHLDRAYMRTIASVYHGGPVGLETVAATMNEDAGTLEDVVEPYLLQIGFLARTRRGRALTHAGAEHLGIALKTEAASREADAGLF
ncbi:MAG: Holliday junction branch migration DNA helicase RuvB [Phycisphaeraceae bacterium]|nr:Holliday junction branch migration DNA helicase RuvB [Phycisphaeraceae bacterium]MCW5754264.1 Holliday junction branch migration DNA helicase RuvB [Phycisphaeraceae bacterium]